MGKIKDFKLAVIALSVKEFNEHPEYKKLIVENEECREYVEDVRELRKAGGPAWFVPHLPKTFWSELEEDVKAYTYKSGLRKRWRAATTIAGSFLLGAILCLSAILFLPPTKNEVLTTFYWPNFFESVSNTTAQETMTMLPAQAKMPWLEKSADNTWLVESFKAIGDSNNEPSKSNSCIYPRHCLWRIFDSW